MTDSGAGLVFTLLPLAFVLAGGLLLWHGLRLVLGDLRQARHRQVYGRTTTGRVVGRTSWSTPHRATNTSTAAGIVAFTDDRGRERTVETVATTMPPRIGREFTVWYDPMDPAARPVVVGDWRRTMRNVGTIVVGAGFAAAGLVFLLLVDPGPGLG